MRSIIKWCSSIIMVAIFIQPTSAQNDEKSFSNRPILTPLANYKAGVGRYNENSGFNLDHAFIGYEGFFTKGFSAKTLMDVETMADENGNIKFNGHLKNVQIDWKGKGFFVPVGLANLKQLSEQENFRGHRHIFKSFQKEYGIVFCEDTGIVAGYKLLPVISAGMALANREGCGFKNMDNNYKYGAGLILKPVKGFMFRLYGDIYNTPKYMKFVSGNQKDQYSIAIFAGYSHSRFSFGAEYNRAFNYRFLPEADINGCSVYTTIKINSKIHSYGRFDLLDVAEENQGTVKEGHTIIEGFEYVPIKQVRISPNYQSWKVKSGKRENYLLMGIKCKI